MDMEKELQQLAVRIAHEEWDNRHGFGLYHTGPKVQEDEIARAREKVDKWFEMLKPAFEAQSLDSGSETTSSSR